MATTRILDNYRLSVISDKNLFRILTLIYNSEAESEKNLERKTGLSLTDLKLTLTKLYCANFIRPSSSQTWRTTFLAEEVLSSLGISELSAISVLSESDLPSTDIIPLQACLAGGYTHTYTWSRDVSSVLRATRTAFDIASQSEPVVPSEKIRTFYAIIIGSNLRAKTIGLETYCKMIAKSYADNHPDAVSVLLNNRLQKEAFLDHCTIAISDFQASNNVFLTGDHKVEKPALLITLARLISSFTEQRDTSNLRDVYAFDNDIFIKAINSLSKWNPSCKFEFKRRIDALPATRIEYMKGGLLWEQTVDKILRSATESPDNTSESTGLFVEHPREQATFRDAISAIHGVQRQIMTGTLDILTSEERSEFVTALTTAANMARKRFDQPKLQNGQKV